MGQGSANDNNANLKYPTLDGRIEATYAARSAATNKNSLYDSYIRAIRWASDRIGDAGVIGFVTNGGFIEANSHAGVRLCLGEELSDVYIYNLRGNARTAGELREKEAGNVFGAGSRNTVVVSLLVKNPAHTGPATIHYLDIGDYLSREEKLAKVARANLEEMEWARIARVRGRLAGPARPAVRHLAGHGRQGQPERCFQLLLCWDADQQGCLGLLVFGAATGRKHKSPAEHLSPNASGSTGNTPQTSWQEHLFRT